MQIDFASRLLFATSHQSSHKAENFEENYSEIGEKKYDRIFVVVQFEVPALFRAWLFIF